MEYETFFGEAFSKKIYVGGPAANIELRGDAKIVVKVVGVVKLEGVPL